MRHRNLTPIRTKYEYEPSATATTLSWIVVIGAIYLFFKFFVY